MTPTARSLTLIAEMKATLDAAQNNLSVNQVPDENLALLESKLVEIHRWRPDIAQLTGPGGYDPKPSYEKCSTCGHYRLP